VPQIQLDLSLDRTRVATLEAGEYPPELWQAELCRVTGRSGSFLSGSIQRPYLLSPYFLTIHYHFHISFLKKTPWSESASELYRPSDRRLSAKWLPTFLMGKYYKMYKKNNYSCGSNSTVKEAKPSVVHMISIHKIPIKCYQGLKSSFLTTEVRG
jgi:hypothetical protein